MNAGRVYALCLRLLADKDLADQITKSVFLYAWRNISTLRVDISFASWLCSIAVYSSLEILRQNNSSAGKINEKKFKGVNISAFETEIFSLPVTERLMFVLHDLERYTEEEAAEMLLIKTEDAKKSLTEAYSLLKAANSSLSQVTPLSERIKSLTSQILPGNEIWKQISSEIQAIKSRSTVKDENVQEQSGEPENHKQEKKFNIFGWKRK